MPSLLEMIFLWWINGIIATFIASNVIPAVLSVIPPIRGIFMKILNITLVIRLPSGTAINIGGGAIVGWVLFHLNGPSIVDIIRVALAS